MNAPNLKSTYDGQFFDNQIRGSVNSAHHCLQPLLDLYQPSSAIDVGCGRGGWLAELVARGVNDIQGIDGSPIEPDKLLIDPKSFMVQDLTKPLSFERTFELAMSLEVAEHLPPESADNFIDLLTSLAPVILFSAAIPQQGGIHHVNEQWPSYWSKKFETNGYGWVDTVRPAVWQNPEVQMWYAQNIIIYIRRDQAESLGQLGAQISAPGTHPDAIVHPELFEIKAHEAKKLRRRMNRLQPWRPLIKSLKKKMR